MGLALVIEKNLLYFCRCWDSPRTGLSVPEPSLGPDPRGGSLFQARDGKGHREGSGWNRSGDVIPIYKSECHVCPRHPDSGLHTPVPPKGNQGLVGNGLLPRLVQEMHEMDLVLLKTPGMCR